MLKLSSAKINKKCKSIFHCYFMLINVNKLNLIIKGYQLHF